jgi:hypothetical protein
MAWWKLEVYCNAQNNSYAYNILNTIAQSKSSVPLNELHSTGVSFLKVPYLENDYVLALNSL